MASLDWVMIIKDHKTTKKWVNLKKVFITSKEKNYCADTVVTSTVLISVACLDGSDCGSTGPPEIAVTGDQVLLLDWSSFLPHERSMMLEVSKIQMIDIFFI